MCSWLAKKFTLAIGAGGGPTRTASPARRDAERVVRVDDRSIASEGSVSVIDLQNDLVGRDSVESEFSGEKDNIGARRSLAPPEIVTGLHASALALSPNGKYLAVANTGSDTVSVIDTRTDKIVETICARQNPGDPFGAQPDALAFDKSGKTLFVCNGTQNAVAVFQFKPGESKLLGLIPVGWFPGAIVYDARRGNIDVANIKSIGAKTETAKKGLGNGSGFNTKQYTGSLSLVPVPSAKELAAFTQTALADLRYPLLAQAKLPPRENRPPQPVPERAGEPGVFQHVIYIIKENRSYDQVLGDVTRGQWRRGFVHFRRARHAERTQARPRFCAAGQHLLLRHLERRRPSMGRQRAWRRIIWSASFAGWPRSYPSGGDGEDTADALAYSPAGFIWNDALAHGKTVCDFGEFTSDKKRWKDSARKGKPGFLDCYRNFMNGGDEIALTDEPDIEALRPYIMTNTIGWDLDVPDIFRAAQFIKSLKQFEAADNLPNLVILWLPNDHTSATKAGSPTPEAQVADNDLAMGQIVEAVSHSKFWTNTCVFAVEDDPQDGWDHVSGYRTTAYVASAYTRRGAVIHTQYNQTSLLRTMELMLGLPPMNQMDATATPMFDCFTNTPDYTAFDAVTNNVPLDEMNKSAREIHRRAIAEGRAGFRETAAGQGGSMPGGRIQPHPLARDERPADAVSRMGGEGGG